MIHYLIWLAVVVLYAPIFLQLYKAKWETIDYTHAYFILPISLYLAWRKRHEVAETFKYSPSGGNIGSIFTIILALLMYYFGWQQEYLLISTFSMVPLLFGIIIFLYGTKTAKLLMFPVLYLLMLVPPPLGILDSITLPMRYGISALSEDILAVMNYPISRDGLLLTVGYTDIFMGQPCSGFRSLITMFSLVLVYVYLNKGTLFKKFILTAFIIPFALFGNLVRVITLCLITFYFGEEAGQGFFHGFSGIVIFVITLSGLMGMESLLSRSSTRFT